MARLRRKVKADKRPDPVDQSDAVDLSDGDHAWWATRPRLMHTYGYTSDATDQPAPPTANPWSYEEVFQAGVDGNVERDDERNAQCPPDHRNLAEVFAEESSYRALDLEPGATWDEVVASHRRIAKRYHPDRLIDADAETRADGEAKMREANAAYENLRKATNIQPHTQTSGLFGP